MTTASVNNINAMQQQKKLSSLNQRSLRMRQAEWKRWNTWVLLLLYGVCCCSRHWSVRSRLPVANASWIDPDTPMDARSTEPYTPSVPKMEPSKKDDDDKKKKHKRRFPFTWPPSMSPSFQPSSTPVPSEMPSGSPSMYPTWTPDSFELVFSDEFNTPQRNFADGNDPRWTALDKNDYTNDALHYYSPMNAWTNDGQLHIKSEAADTDVVGFDDVKRKKTHVTKHFRSAMLQTWNKFCFTGGIIEAKVTLPGKSDVGGLWPAFWLLGNLARHTYVGSSEHIWPWSSVVCTEKSSTAQLISGCHPRHHYDMESNVGRGAPEMDIFEVQPGNVRANTGVFLRSTVGQPFMSASFQVAPGRSDFRPGNGYWPGPGQWYEGLKGGSNASLNINFYGNYNHFLSDTRPAQQDYWSDAISYNRQLTEDHFKQPHVYRLEWDVPTDEREGYLRWYLDGELVLWIPGRALTNSGLGSEISSEPSYILFNVAISKQWGFPLKCPENCPCKDYDCHSSNWQSTCGFSEGFCDMITKPESAPVMKVDYVRVYQNPNDPAQKVGCSTPERPTRKFILAHENLYKTKADEHPLRGVQRGRGMCDIHAVGEVPEACGGEKRGRCSLGDVCECMPGWTGSNCLVHDGSDPILYDRPDQITDLGFHPPGVAPRGFILGMAVLLVLFLTAVIRRTRSRSVRHPWTPIPDVVAAAEHSNDVKRTSYEVQRLTRPLT